MPLTTFVPSIKTIDVSSGTELLDAARKAEIEIESPCGGKGTCGKCIVRIISGSIDSDSLGLLSASAIEKGFTLACKTKVLDASVMV